MSKGYEKPNYTQTPNVLLDRHMATMREAELKVVFSVCRKTFGWHKNGDMISLSQLQKLTGMSRQGVLNGITNAIKRGVLQRRPEGNSFVYSLVVNEDDQSKPDSQRGGLADSQRGGHTKETLKKKTRPADKSDYVVAMEELEQAFANLRNCQLPDWDKDPKGSNKLWRTPLKKIWSACNKDTGATKSFISRAVSKMRSDELTFVYPAQIETVALSIIADSKGEKKHQYARTY